MKLELSFFLRKQRTLTRNNLSKIYFLDQMKKFSRVPELSAAENDSIHIFTITAEIHARSLATFYGQYADRHMNLAFVRRVSERERETTICYRKKQIDVSFYASVLLSTMNFRHNIVKVVCGSTRLSPRGFTATFTTL